MSSGLGSSAVSTQSLISNDVTSITYSSADTASLSSYKCNKRQQIITARNAYRRAMYECLDAGDKPNAYFYYKVAARWTELLNAFDAGISVDPAKDAPTPTLVDNTTVSSSVT